MESARRITPWARRPWRAAGGREAILQTRRGLLFPSPEARVSLWSHVCSSPGHRPRPQIQEREGRRASLPLGQSQVGRRRASPGPRRVRSWEWSPRPGGSSLLPWGLWLEPCSPLSSWTPEAAGVFSGACHRKGWSLRGLGDHTREPRGPHHPVLLEGHFLSLRAAWRSLPPASKLLWAGSQFTGN